MNITNNPKLAKYRDFAGIALILTLAVIATFYGGYDYKVAYRGDTLAGTYGAHSFTPYPMYWFIYPFAVLPESLGYLLWNLANALCFILAVRYWKGDLLAFSFFIGVFWTFYGGQLEGFVSGALVVAMLPNPWLAGLGITYLSLKPQVGALPILFVLLHRKDWKLLVVPALVYLASFIHWGWWVPRWLAALLPVGVEGPFMSHNVGLYPYGLIFLLLLWRYRASLRLWMLVQSLMMPYSPIYSLAPLLTIRPAPIWWSIAIWIFYLAMEKNLALSLFGFIFPLLLLAGEIWRIERQRIEQLHPAPAEEQAAVVDVTVHEKP